MSTGLRILAIVSLVALSGSSADRAVLKKQASSLPNTPEPTLIAEAQTVRYDPHSQTYVFSYTVGDGTTREMYFELPTKIDVVVEGQVTREEKEEPFVYEYLLHNLATSHQGVNVFAVITPEQLNNPTVPDPGWRARTLPSPVFPATKGIYWSDGQRRAGIPAPPVPYAESASEIEALRLHVRRPVASPYAVGVPPGTKQRGFSFSSARLPGIVTCYARGANFTPITYGEPPEEIELLVHQNNFLFVEGKTIGPVLSSQEDPASRLERLVQWTAEAEELGWVTDATAARVLAALHSSSQEWRAHRFDSMAGALRDTLRLAEEERDKTITDELYYILHFNIEALLNFVESAP